MRVRQLLLAVLVATAAGLRVPPPCMMGRAENRKAAKAAKKKGGGGGAATPMARNDVLPREIVEKRMSEVPVFRISGKKLVADGTPNLFLDAAEAEAAAARLGAGRVECCTLDKVFFDRGNIMQPSRRAIDELSRTPQRMTPDVIVPVFCIDGLQVEDKGTGDSSLPLFFSRSELLDFAKKCMEKPESRVMVTDLGVVVQNMIQGPVGLLRGARFFPSEPALKYVDGVIAETKKQNALFPAEAGFAESIADREQPEAASVAAARRQSGGLFGGGGGGGGIFPGSGGIFPD